MADADRIAELDEQMTRQARQADALQRKLALLRSVATSPCGEVTVEGGFQRGVARFELDTRGGRRRGRETGRQDPDHQ